MSATMHPEPISAPSATSRGDGPVPSNGEPTERVLLVRLVGALEATRVAMSVGLEGQP